MGTRSIRQCLCRQHHRGGQHLLGSRCCSPIVQSLPQNHSDFHHRDCLKSRQDQLLNCIGELHLPRDPGHTNSLPKPYNGSTRIQCRMLNQRQLEDVTLVKRDEITAHERFRHHLPHYSSPAQCLAGKDHAPGVVAQIGTLLADHTDGEVAAILNARDIKTGADVAFSSAAVKWVRFNHHDFSCPRRNSTSQALGKQNSQAGKSSRNPLLFRTGNSLRYPHSPLSELFFCHCFDGCAGSAQARGRSRLHARRISDDR